MVNSSLDKAGYFLGHVGIGEIPSEFPLPSNTPKVLEVDV